jgi:hypothetical protein
MTRRRLVALALVCSACTTVGPEDPEDPSDGQPSPYRLALGPFTNNTVNLAVGGSLRIQVQVQTTAGQPVVPDWGPTFRSRYPNQVSVDHEGLITALALGSTVITIEAEVGAAHVEDSVSVVTLCTSELRVELTPATQIMAPGEGFQPMLTLSSCGGHVTLTDTYTWTSSDPTIVSVVPTSGAATALRPGTAVVRVRGARYPFQAEIQVTVQ